MSLQGLPFQGSGSRGRPSTLHRRCSCSPRWCRPRSCWPGCAACPDLERHRVAAARRVVGSSTPSRSHAIAPAPSSSAASRCIRWLRPPWCTLPIDAAGPGVRPARARHAHPLVRPAADALLAARAHRARWRTTGPRAAELARAATSRRSTPEPPMRSTPPEPEPDTICRSPDERGAGDPPAVADVTPTRCESGTRTSSRNTSLKSISPPMWRSGRTSTPGCVQVDQEVGEPRRLATSGSVRARQTRSRRRCAHVVQTFWPLTTHSSPSRSARGRERREVGAGAGLAEELAPLLLVARRAAARNRRRCSSVPCAKSAGAARVQAERVQPAEVERREARPRRPRAWRGAEVEAAVRDRPGGHREAAAANSGYQAS